MSRLWGIHGTPFLDLSELVDTSCFPALDREIADALVDLPTEYTGGTLKWMGVVAPWAMDDGYEDAMHAIERFSRDELARFVALGDAPDSVDLDAARAFGDETAHPFSRAQQRWLETAHGVYFPWKACFHLVENGSWDDKHSGAGKGFCTEARARLPKTVAFIESLPFSEIGRAVLFGIEANDHAPAHRDTEPGSALSIAQSISFDPRGGKGLYLRDPEGGSHTVVDAPIYWFNDMDYHGVEAAPRFRYSIRVDGVFEADFARRLDATFGRRRK